MEVLVSDISVLIDLRRRESIYRKKLIEVALPLDAINPAAVREGSIRHGRPSTCISGGLAGGWPQRGR